MVLVYFDISIYRLKKKKESRVKIGLFKPTLTKKKVYSSLVHTSHSNLTTRSHGFLRVTHKLSLAKRTDG